MKDFKQITGKQRDFFLSGATLDLGWRIEMLKTLKNAIVKNEDKIIEALGKDLNKSPFEAYETEVGIVLDEIRFAIKNLRKWARPHKVKTPLMHFPSRSCIYSDPYGVVLIMSPWNYPFQLTIAPLIGAITAGNCAIVKPSAYSPAISAAISQMLGECFKEEYITVVEGGRDANKALLENKFDYIFFTGSVEVGKNVMEAASRFLTPVTLELGGKSPCIVSRDADIDIAAKRIVWGKFLNAGQTCVAPDYILVHKAVKAELLEKLKLYITQFFGDNPCENNNLPRIINEKHFLRVKGLLEKGRIITGGACNKEKLRIAPTIIDGITWDDAVMQEEIFGPVLPVLVFSDLSEVIDAVNKRPKPLALYLFTTSKEVENTIIRRISFGGGCVNDTITHLATSHMPFGGVGESGMGGYHGKWSFETFSHEKSILKKSNKIDINVRYHPYGNKLGLLKKILK